MSLAENWSGEDEALFASREDDFLKTLAGLNLDPTASKYEIGRAHV